MTLNIAGKDYVLNFGVNWFYEFYKQDSSHDLIKDPAFEIVDMQSTELFKTVQSLIWAGLKSESEMKGEACPIGREAVTHYVMSMDITAVTEVLWQIIACVSGTSVDKLKAEPIEEKKSLTEPVGMN